MGVGTGNLYGGWCFVLQGLVPKVVRDMAEIRYVVVDWTNFCKVDRFEDSDGGFL